MIVSVESTYNKFYKKYNAIGLSIVNGAPAMKNIDLELLKLCDIFCVNELEVLNY